VTTVFITIGQSQAESANGAAAEPLASERPVAAKQHILKKIRHRSTLNAARAKTKDKVNVKRNDARISTVWGTPASCPT
jgi:hypothetical protein